MICPECNATFECSGNCKGKGLVAHRCFGCNYAAQMDAAAKRFEPLSAPLARLLEVQPWVEQTGGMTMCLRIDLAHGFHVWFSEFDAVSETSFGVYHYDEEHDEQGEVWVGDAASDIPYRASHGEEIAAWAAPLIMAVADQVARGTALPDITVGHYRPH
jgi:hypothetical protein